MVETARRPLLSQGERGGQPVAGHGSAKAWEVVELDLLSEKVHRAV